MPALQVMPVRLDPKMAPTMIITYELEVRSVQKIPSITYTLSSPHLLRKTPKMVGGNHGELWHSFNFL
jgi:hypothetical protein